MQSILFNINGKIQHTYDKDYPTKISLMGKLEDFSVHPCNYNSLGASSPHKQNVGGLSLTIKFCHSRSSHNHIYEMNPLMKE